MRTILYGFLMIFLPIAVWANDNVLNNDLFMEELNICISSHSPVQKVLAESVCNLFSEDVNDCNFIQGDAIRNFHTASKEGYCDLIFAPTSLANEQARAGLQEVRKIENAQAFVLVHFDHGKKDTDSHKIGFAGEYSDVHLMLMRDIMKIGQNNNDQLFALSLDFADAIKDVGMYQIDVLIYVVDDFIDGDLFALAKDSNLMIRTVESVPLGEGGNSTLSVFYNSYDIGHMNSFEELMTLAEAKLAIVRAGYIPISIYASDTPSLDLESLIADIQKTEHAHLLGKDGFPKVMADSNVLLDETAYKMRLITLLVQAKTREYVNVTRDAYKNSIESWREILEKLNIDELNPIF